jgi:hypothetical protein
MIELSFLKKQRIRDRPSIIHLFYAHFIFKFLIIASSPVYRYHRAISTAAAAADMPGTWNDLLVSDPPTAFPSQHVHIGLLITAVWLLTQQNVIKSRQVLETNRPNRRRSSSRPSRSSYRKLPQPVSNPPIEHRR